MSLRHRVPNSDDVSRSSHNSSGTELDDSDLLGVLPPYLLTLLEGTEVGLRNDLPQHPFEKPVWLDMNRVRRGQEFAMAHIFGLMNANGMAVLLVSAYQTILQPLIYTGKSATPYNAFRRYLDTVTYVKAWYEGDLWEEGTGAHKSMKVVRGMHDRIKKKMTNSPKEEVDKRGTLEGTPMWTTLHEELIEDFKESCPELTTPLRGDKLVYVNQADLAITQFGFVGLVIMYPSMFGIHNVTDDLLNDFIHLWRAIGFLLGIEDRYNLCDGDLQTVRRRGRQLLHYWLKPLLRQGSREWVHMGRCLASGVGHYVPGSTYEITMLYLCSVLEIPAPRLRAALGVGQRVMYKFVEVLYGVLLRWKPMWTLVNYLMDRSMKQARNMSQEYLHKLKSRVYDYETNSQD